MSKVVTGGVREQLEDALIKAVRTLGVEGELPDLELGRAKAAERGEYASSAGLKLARVLLQPPAQIAARIAETIVVPDGAATAEAVGGYVNFRLTAAWLQRLVAEVTATGPTYGSAGLRPGERRQGEVPSDDPTRATAHRHGPG